MPPSASQAFQQPPAQNASIVGYAVYSHSGEFAPRSLDFSIPGRGLPLQFVRSYRSGMVAYPGPLGRAWIFNYAARLANDGSDILYEDGYGNRRRFKRARSGVAWAPPPGSYAVLQQKRDHFVLSQRYGRCLHFEMPDVGGRLLRIEDRNANALSFVYGQRMVAIDTFGREVTFSFRQHLLTKVRDYSGRTWCFRYR